jgi:CheY-like chemotaxis protein
MPVMDGHEVLHLLMETSATYQIPFIFSTSMYEQVDRKEALSLDADDYIVMPFDVEVLLRTVRKWIRSGSGRHLFTLDHAS